MRMVTALHPCALSTPSETTVVVVGSGCHGGFMSSSDALVAVRALCQLIVKQRSTAVKPLRAAGVLAWRHPPDVSLGLGGGWYVSHLGNIRLVIRRHGIAVILNTTVPGVGVRESSYR
jgi:hypothetical protein